MWRTAALIVTASTLFSAAQAAPANAATAQPDTAAHALLADDAATARATSPSEVATSSAHAEPSTSSAIPAPSASPPAAPAAIAPSPAFSNQQLTALPSTNWITNGGNLYNQRYSPLSAINRDNVKDLKGVWRTHLNGSGLGGPVLPDRPNRWSTTGVIYIVTGNDDVFALDVKTGANLLWTYEAHMNPDRVHVCCGWISRLGWAWEPEGFTSANSTPSWSHSTNEPAKSRGPPRRKILRRATASSARRCISMAW